MRTLAEMYLIAGGALAAGLIAFVPQWLKSRRVGGARIVAIAATVAFDSRGITDGKSLAIGWNELEKMALGHVRGSRGPDDPGPVLLQLSGHGKTVLVASTAAGWDDLLERLASLPGANRDAFELARAKLAPGGGLTLTIWEKSPAPLQAPSLMVHRGSEPSLASYLSQTLIRWRPQENAFELARFDKEPAKVTERLIVPYAALEGFRLWWRGSVLMSGWRHRDEEPVSKIAPPMGYCCLQIWAGDPKWAGFQIDLAHDATGEQMDPILANLTLDWYGRFDLAFGSS